MTQTVQTRAVESPGGATAGLEALDVHKSYPTPGEPLVVLRGVSLSIASGESLAIVGPSGLLAWGANLRLLDQRRAEIARLSHQRDELKIQVDALDPNHADPDLVGELIRKNLNVVHPDEIVITLKPQG